MMIRKGVGVKKKEIGMCALALKLMMKMSNFDAIGNLLALSGMHVIIMPT